MMKYTEKQINAIKMAVKWYFRDSFKKNIFVIGGYAGTGKSTIVNKIVESLGLNTNSVLFCAYTGKATLVLRLKGNRADTIHKTFYNIRKTENGFIFTLKKEIDPAIQLIIVDELSMVNQNLMSDILSFGVPVIGLGDPGQLPPIFGGNNYIKEENLDCFLTEVMRQEDSSGILQLATMARESIDISLGTYKKSKVVHFNEVKNKLHEYDVVLCWRNMSRKELNKFIRSKLLNIKQYYPIKGDKLLCLKNNYNHLIEFNSIPIFLTNGLLGYSGETASVEKGDDRDIIRLLFKPDFTDDDNYFDIPCHKEIFDDYKKMISKHVFITKPEEDEFDGFFSTIAHVDYGYALTVHKSQGSEWNNVLVIDEFRGRSNDYPKWLYTGITRAKESVTIAKI